MSQFTRAYFFCRYHTNCMHLLVDSVQVIKRPPSNSRVFNVDSGTIECLLIFDKTNWYVRSKDLKGIVFAFNDSVYRPTVW